MLNQKFLNFRYRSFYIDQLLICANVTIFFQLDDFRWFSLSIGEGSIDLLEEQNEPKCQSLSDIKDSFAYPIGDLIELDCVKGMVLKGVFEYRLKANLDFSVGLYFKLDAGGISIIENNGNLSIVSGMADELLEQSQLIVHQTIY